MGFQQQKTRFSGQKNGSEVDFWVFLGYFSA
jgi:hypothetical protein